MEPAQNKEFCSSHYRKKGNHLWNTGPIQGGSETESHGLGEADHK